MLSVLGLVWSGFFATLDVLYSEKPILHNQDPPPPQNSQIHAPSGEAASAEASLEVM